MSILVVLAVVAIALRAGSARQRSATTIGGAASEVVLKLQAPSPGSTVTSAVVGREISALRARLRDAAGLSGERFVRLSSDVLAIHSGALAASGPMRQLLTRDPQISVIDWEGNLISPDGRTVASQLLESEYRPAQILSQGGGTGVSTLPGGPGAGAQTLYAAVRLASRQPAFGYAADQTRQGPELFAFAPANSPHCRSSAAPCWAAGPSTTRAAVIRRAQHAGVSNPIVLTVRQGTSVVQATGSRSNIGAEYRERTARFFVLRDAAALTTAELRSPSTTSQHGVIAVKASLTPAGARAFTHTTAVIAHRGQSLRLGTDSNYQHFAIVDNGAILEVAIINYQEYPDGVQPPVSHGFEIEGISHATAEQITQQIKLGALPLKAQIVRASSQ